MERKRYLELCQRCAVIPSNGLFGKKEIPLELTVFYAEMRLYPVAYILYFDRLGKAKHSAKLHSLNSNSEIICNLDDVKEATNEKHIDGV